MTDSALRVTYAILAGLFGLLIGSFLYLPQGFYGALVQILARLTGSNNDAPPAASAAKSAVRAS